MNLLKTAEALGIHRNTIQQRYARLKGLLNIDPLVNDRDRIFLRQYALLCDRKKTFNIGICIQDGSALHECCSKFAELLYEKSGGSLLCNIHTILLSGNNTVLLELLKNGSLDFIIIDSHSLKAETDDKVLVFDIPFLFDSAEEADYVLDGEFGNGFNTQLKQHGLINLAFFSTGFRHISTRSHFITCPEDLDSLRIRIMYKPLTETYFRSVNAIPIMASYSDIRTLLHRGVIDSQENPYANFLAMKFYDYQSYISEVPMYYGVGFFLTASAAMRRLSVDERRIIDLAAQEASAWHKEFLVKFNNDSRDTLINKYGIKVYPMEKQPIKAWKASAKLLYKTYPDQKTLLKLQEAKREYAKEALSKSV
jgi:TRAP-type C4-dicarboxylate transport system substrate-binding protein